MQTHTEQIQQNTSTLYFFRESNYKGLGRVHLLKIDEIAIGPLESNNYYRIELWPGTYHLTVHLPTEAFLGQIRPAENISMQLTINAIHGPVVELYKHLDGSGIHRISSNNQEAITRLETQRQLSKSLNARDTAQVKSFYGTRYDGPSIGEKAHGLGKLTWEDGSEFRGRFQHGEATTEGRFIWPDGRIYLGPNNNGRPAGPGVLLSTDGQIVYAGNLLNETPHGPGFRRSRNGPEFCEYDNGSDVTKTVRQLVIEAIEKEDHKRMNRIVGIPDFLGWNSGTPPAQATLDHLVTPAGEKMERQDGQAVQSPYLRMLAKQKEVDLALQQQIETKRAWCKKEALLGRRLCVCAPFDENFNDWSGCESR